MILKYQTSEKIKVARPVNRIAYISNFCANKVILDIGCYDETAINQKLNTKFWLHGNLIKKSIKVIGVDNSALISADGLDFNGIRIFKEDALNLSAKLIAKEDYDVIVAGEFIEHIEDPSIFLREIKKNFSSERKKRYLLISTPNGVSFANTLMGILGREMQHKDHLSAFTYKILSTLFLKNEFNSWEIIPYKFVSAELKLRSRGLRYFGVICIEKFINVVEYFFPLLSSGYIVVAEI